MKYKYGEFSEEQMSRYKIKLHNRLFWLLLYKDPETCEDYKDIDFDKYIVFLMKELDGFNHLFEYPTNMVRIVSLIQAAYDESSKEDFNYKVYRKLVLDAQNLVDKIEEVVRDNC